MRGGADQLVLANDADTHVADPEQRGATVENFLVHRLHIRR